MEAGEYCDTFYIFKTYLVGVENSPSLNQLHAGMSITVGERRNNTLFDGKMKENFKKMRPFL